jgi:hypothetical protein
LTRLDALYELLRALPPPGEPASDFRFEVNADGVINFPFIQTDPAVQALFDAFNEGTFGIAHDDAEYIAALERRGFGSSNSASLTKRIAVASYEDCLLLLRRLDRGERFCDGLQAAACKDGTLHALLLRLIEIERRESDAEP